MRFLPPEDIESATIVFGRSYVYVIEEEEDPEKARSALRMVKIGVANNPYARMAGLQCGNARFLRVIFLVEFAARRDADAFEAHLHKVFRRAQVHLEWFGLDPAEIGRVLAAAVGGNDGTN